MSLDGKVALVTGGAGGLGSVHCLVLARKGADIALVDSNIDKAETIVEEVRKLGRKVLPLKLDISNEDEVVTAVAKVKQELGPVDILLNNAAFGIVRAVTIVNTEKKDWDRDLEVNLTGAFNCIKAVMPDMLERKWGRIINVSSVVGILGGKGQASYAATKAGLLGLTKTVALEGARQNVTCNAVVLGVFDGGSFNDVADKFRERIIKRVALRRPGNPEELSNVIGFLASDESSYVTGTEMIISGGIHLFTY